MRILAAERACPGCGADDAVPITRPFLRATCPACRRRSLRFKIIGIS
jgi:hypothetical protein